MRRKFVLVGLTALFLFCATSVYAEPFLQIDLASNDGSVGYNDTVGDVVGTGTSFTVYALQTPEGQTSFDTSTYFYFSVALVEFTNGTYGPSSSNPDGLTFTWDSGAPVSVTEGMVFGVPPVESVQGHDPGDLPQHGVFGTNFWQSPGFQFTGEGQTVETYNVQDDPGTFGSQSQPGDTAWEAFSFEVAGLTSGYGLHLDLYSIVAQSPDLDVGAFAPFSHDATVVPEPATMLLLGSGLIGLVAIGRRRISGIGKV